MDELLNNSIDKLNMQKLEVALKSNHLYMFLLGSGIYKTDSGYMSSEMVVNTGAIMHTIYDYSRKVSNLGNQLQASLEFLANIKTFQAVYTTMEIEQYQMSAEKSGVAPFKLDNKKILQILENNIKTNLELYNNKGELGMYTLDNGLYPLIEKYNENFTENYGNKIL